MYRRYCEVCRFHSVGICHLAMGSHQRFLSMRVACSNLCSEIPLSAVQRRDWGGGGWGCSFLEPRESAIVAIVSGVGLKRPRVWSYQGGKKSRHL